MAVQPLSPVPGPPDLAGAYGRGGALALQRQQLEQQAIESERNAQIQRQQIAAQQQIANQRAMQAQTQAAIENQMNQARLGLAEREMAAQEAEFERRSQEAARTFQARQQYQALVEGGMDPREAMMRLLPELDLPAGAYRAAGAGRDMIQPESMDVPGAPHMQAFRTGAGSVQYREKPPEPGQYSGPSVTPIPGFDEYGVATFGQGREQLIRLPDVAAQDAEDLKILTELHKNDIAGRTAAGRNPDDLGRHDKAAAEAYQARDKEIKDLMKKIRDKRTKGRQMEAPDLGVPEDPLPPPPPPPEQIQDPREYESSFLDGEFRVEQKPRGRSLSPSEREALLSDDWRNVGKYRIKEVR